MGVRRISRELEGDFTLSDKIGFKLWQLIPGLQEFGCASIFSPKMVKHSPKSFNSF